MGYDSNIRYSDEINKHLDFPQGEYSKSGGFVYFDEDLYYECMIVDGILESTDKAVKVNIRVPKDFPNLLQDHKYRILKEIWLPKSRVYRSITGNYNWIWIPDWILESKYDDYLAERSLKALERLNILPEDKDDGWEAY